MRRPLAECVEKGLSVGAIGFEPPMKGNDGVYKG